MDRRISDILDLAIQREEQAYDFYMDIYGYVEDQSEGARHSWHIVTAMPTVNITANGRAAVASSPITMYLRSGHFPVVSCGCFSGGLEATISGYFIDGDQTFLP